VAFDNRNAQVSAPRVRSFGQQTTPLVVRDPRDPDAGMDFKFRVMNARRLLLARGLAVMSQDASTHVEEIQMGPFPKALISTSIT